VEELDEIIKGCKAGKRAAQGKLYKLLSKKMFGVCLIYTKDYTAAEDVLQEGFVKVFSHIAQYQNTGSFEGWVRKIMVNTALERFRRQKLLYSDKEVEEYANDFSYDDIVSNISARDLLDIVQELTPQYRMVFSLYALEGYTHKEIADQLGISEGASKSNLSRARVILQHKVEKLFQHKRIAIV